MKKVLVQEGFAEQLANVVSTCKDATGDEILKQRTQSAADMIVMLLTEGQYLIFILLKLFIVVFVFILQLELFANNYFLGEKLSRGSGLHQPFNSQDLISNSPSCFLYNLYDVSLENLELDQQIIL